MDAYQVYRNGELLSDRVLTRQDALNLITTLRKFGRNSVAKRKFEIRPA